jgi:hypothetical protein
VEIVIAWIVLSILAGVYAGRKGRSSGGYCLLALILSPILVFVLLLILPPIGKVVEQRAVEEGELKKCPECAELVKAEAKKCRFCGYEFEYVAPPTV